MVRITGHGEDAGGASAMARRRGGEGVVFGACGTAEERCLLVLLAFSLCLWSSFGVVQICVVWARGRFKISHFLTARKFMNRHNVLHRSQTFISVLPHVLTSGHRCVQPTRRAGENIWYSDKMKSSVMGIRGTLLTSQMRHLQMGN